MAMPTIRVIHEAETAAQLAGKWLAWDRAYMRLRATHPVRQAALLALREIGHAEVADRLEPEIQCSPPEKS